MNSSNEVSLIICAKAEEKTLGAIIEQARGYVSEVIVVLARVDGDDSYNIATDLGARCIDDLGKGKGLAIQAGIVACQYPYIVFMDADGSHDAHDITKLLVPLKEGRADLVIGSRIQGGSDELGGGLENSLRLIGSSIITLGINLRFKTHLTDSQNGFRAVLKDKIDTIDLKENSTTIEQEILIKMLKRNYRVSEVATHEYQRRFGNSHISLKRAWPRYLYSWLKLLLTP
jgi:glycosyltransferase involved in cell wall biosynthesis